MKRILALSLIVGIIICAVCATSFSAERTIGRLTEENQTGNDLSYNRAVGDLIDETQPETTEETDIVETRVEETQTTDETVGEDETTPEETETPTEAETVTETTVEPTTTDDTDTPATGDSATPDETKDPHRAVKTGDNGLLFLGIGLLAVALITLFVTMRKRSRSYDK